MAVEKKPVRPRHYQPGDAVCCLMTRQMPVGLVRALKAKAKLHGLTMKAALIFIIRAWVSPDGKGVESADTEAQA